MLGWMVLPFRRYVDFLGRSRRREFWMFVLLVWLMYVVLFFAFIGSGFSLERVLDAGDRGGFTMAPLLFSGTGMLIGLWWLVTLIPMLAVTVRRLHDRDLSGWWLLGACVTGLVPLINLVAWLALLVVLLLPGDAGANHHGQDPRDPTGADVFA